MMIGGKEHLIVGEEEGEKMGSGNDQGITKQYFSEQFPFFRNHR